MHRLTRTSYHHGALREELLRASLELIETEGVGAVSLRRVARDAGVSPGAPYHHFRDRASLLAALSAQGFTLLAEELAEARAAADSPIRALGALVRAYVDFARRRPAYFRLMFRPELSRPPKHPDIEAGADAADACLEATITDCVRAGLFPVERVEAVAVTVWSLAHGLAALWVDGHLQHHGKGLDALTEQATTLLESGLVDQR